MRLNEQLKNLRLQHKMSQRELAHKMGVSQCTISDTERGINPISTHLLCQYSEIFGLSMDQLNPIRDGIEITDIISLLFQLDDNIDVNVQCRPSGKCYIMFGSGILDEFLSEWKEIKSKRSHNLISQEQYEQWKRRYYI